ncbi:MAG: NAD(P)/FAD-dependent oxidoreductase [Lachnospiraceae bacterium]|nr:NAD(P)/FAD-dependent oxidoreductase [Lachnospiraceae bacterium]
MEQAKSLLMQPGKIGRLEIKNRIMMAPMGTTVKNLDDGFAEYFIERAKGGAGIITLNIMVTKAFEDTSNSVTLDDVTTPIFKRICDECHAYGAKVCAQLHPGCGRIGGPAAAAGFRVPISASACSWLHAPQVPCHELTKEEIGVILDGVRETAKKAIDAGADLIEIHAYGGYLTDQFLTRAWNKRTDEYGGDLEGRARFLTEMMAIIKEVGGPDYPLLVKYCPDHYFPEDPEHRQIDEGLELTQLLVRHGADGLHVDAGCYERWYNAIPPSDLQEMNKQSRSAKIVRENVDIPVLTQGRFANTAKAESALRNHICDFAVIGRGLLADPYLPQKVAEGRPDDIRPCISCNEGCIYKCMKRERPTCAINPHCNYEDGSRDIPKVTKLTRVLVIGGGPGGCSAALYAKEAGCEVELWEKGADLGGNALVAGKPYFKADLQNLSNYYRTALLKAGVPVRYFTEATPELAKEFAPGRIVWAAGGAPLLPRSIPGLDSPNVYTVYDALKNLVPIGKDIIIAGGGQVGVEAALHFDKMGHSVTVIEMVDKILAQPMFPMNEQVLREMIAASDVTWLPATKLVSIEGDCRGNKVTVEGTEGQTVLECETMIMAMGTIPTKPAAEPYEAICPVEFIGESVERGNILTAVHSAWDAVKKICEERQ